MNPKNKMFLKENSQAIFDELLSKYGSLINKVCYFYATDVEDFKDLRQEGLLNLWRSLEKFRGGCSQMTWTYRIILNSCISYTRKNKRRPAEPIENHPELISEDGDKAGMVKELYTLINRLGKMEKALILLWLDDTDYDTLASITGLNKTTVGTRLHRIKGKLVELSNQ